jgi:hypothetical protein
MKDTVTLAPRPEDEELAETQRPKLIRLLVLFSVIMLGGLAFVVFTLIKPVVPDSQQERAAAEQMVRNALPDELSIHFSGPQETSEEAIADSKYRVVGWVDLVTKGGAGTRQVYTCIMHKNPDDEWVADDVNFAEK